MENAQHQLDDSRDDIGAEKLSVVESDLPWLSELYPSSFFHYSSDLHSATNKRGPKRKKMTRASRQEGATSGDDESADQASDNPDIPRLSDEELEALFPAYLFDYSDPNWDINNVRYKKGKGPVDWRGTGKVYNIPPSYTFWPPPRTAATDSAGNPQAPSPNVIPGLSYMLDEKDPNWTHNADRYLRGMGPEDLHRTGRKYEIPTDYLFWKCPKNVTYRRQFGTHFPIDWSE